ncbi:uncharacterized protein ACOB8E_021290 isoform 2-T4 [Sarcophilus harrisii]
MAPGRAPNCADWRLTRAASSCRAGSQLPQGKAPYCGLGLRACAEIYAFTFGLRLSSEPNFSPSLRCSLPWPRNQPFFWRDCRFSSAAPAYLQLGIPGTFLSGALDQESGNPTVRSQLSWQGDKVWTGVKREWIQEE